MDEFTSGQVSGLYARLLSKPLSDVIRRLGARGRIHPDFDLISAKLEANAYLTPFDFSLDVRCLFTSAQKVASDQRNAVLAVSDLSNWFEKHLHRLARSDEEALHYKLNRQRLKVQTIRRAMSLAAAKMAPTIEQLVAPETKPPKHAPAPLINEVQQLLSEATTPEVQLRLLSVLKRHFPNFDPAATVTLQAGDISLRCAEEMKEVLRQAQQQRERMTRAHARDE
jgi:hypothetical protein